MDIQGLDYNTQRTSLHLPEYGREIQQMVEQCKQLPNREDRQRMAEEIVAVMGRLVPQKRKAAEYQQKLWDHLAMISQFELDIDWPFDIQQVQQQIAGPQTVPYSNGGNAVRHYGKILVETIGKLKEMPAGDERDELVRLVANQMKRDLYTFGHGPASNERVANDLAQMTDGAVQLDLSTFKFEPIEIAAPVKAKKKRK